eukprot:Gregarina_sp_Pseudo_9__1690@NODE_2142_length_1131_cov_35_982601_g1976_i0_p1_GENE_NODE_2142_length_1131_cov_35_982601_g1976_i0NODE_2142_length_1131_cov_35_982601_g1976_i0_p1_ORF_typecomplete_len328_score24_74S1P1_nuclease/PF02265_16/1_2e21_NODE_2142_length_1131_cov_35_982601_g1976_i0861069
MRYAKERNPLNLYNATLDSLVANASSTVNQARSNEERENRHNIPLSQDTIQDIITAHGTRFSYNLLIRLFIHILGDVHQPLHTVSRVTPCYPQGDRGGNAVTIPVDQWVISLPGASTGSPRKDVLAANSHPDSVLGNLHQLWDSGAGTLGASYPDFTVQQARMQARTLALRYPPPASLDAKLESIFMESSLLAEQVVYSELRNASCATPYRPSAEYVDTVVEYAHRQVTMAGYHMAAFLFIFIRDIPKSVSMLLPAELDPIRLRAELQFWKTVAVSAVLAFVVSAMAAVFFGVALRQKWPSVVFLSSHSSKEDGPLRTRLLSSSSKI